MDESRRALSQCRRIIFKLGTRVLVNRNGRPNPARLRALVAELAALHHAGHEVIVVSSGAIGAGMQALDMKKRPTRLPDLQMAAAVGQTKLMGIYDELFGAKGCRIGQILLNHDDLKHRTRHLNARNTMMNLLRHRVIPVVNENDATTVEEITLGDNDNLAALVTILVDGDLLMLMTCVDGLRAPSTSGKTRRVAYLPRVDQAARELVFGKGDALSSGGMVTKLNAAEAVNRIGALAVIADGSKPANISRILKGDDRGTLIGRSCDGKGHYKSKRKQWIAFFNKPAGSVQVDAGAQKAILEKGTSLLPIGIRKIEGDFPIGSVLQVKDRAGQVFALGLSDYASDHLRKIMGQKSSEIRKILGTGYYDEAIHRDNMVIV